jgi:hypothetical protein
MGVGGWGKRVEVGVGGGGRGGGGWRGWMGKRWLHLRPPHKRQTHARTMRIHTWAVHWEAQTAPTHAQRLGCATQRAPPAHTRTHAAPAHAHPRARRTGCGGGRARWAHEPQRAGPRALRCGEALTAAVGAEGAVCARPGATQGVPPHGAHHLRGVAISTDAQAHRHARAHVPTCPRHKADVPTSYG